MGYRISMVAGKITVHAEHANSALQALKRLAEDQRSGRAFAHYARDVRPYREATSLGEILDCYGWGWKMSAGGNIEVGRYQLENSDDEEQVLIRIAPFVVAGFAEFRGESGERWRYNFCEGKLYKQEAQFVWGPEKDLSV